MFKEADGQILLKVARAAIETHLNGKKFKLPKEMGRFSEACGVFVSLHKDGQLCGCVGLPWPTKPLSEGLVEAAVQASEDRRFSPLVPDEVPEIEIEVSVLSQPEELKSSEPDDILSKLKPNVNGLIVRKGERGALFLPQVWEQIPDPEEFLTHLCVKAGLSPSAWTEKGCQFWRFKVQIFKDLGKNDL